MVYEALLLPSAHLACDSGKLNTSVAGAHIHESQITAFRSKQVKLWRVIIKIISIVETGTNFRINYFNLSSVDFLLQQSE